jgi:hypothetical protein
MARSDRLELPCDEQHHAARGAHSSSASAATPCFISIAFSSATVTGCRDPDPRRSAGIVEIHVDSSPFVHGSSDSRSTCAREVQVGRQGLALSKRDL